MSDTIRRLNAALEGRYHVEKELGEGGMATVYLARDLRHDRDVAIKVLREDLAVSVGSDRFLREVRITANLRHPHILPLFDSGEAGGFLFYVMPHVVGQTLKERLAQVGALPIDEAARILRDVVDALSSAHEAGVVHRDVKPANILLSGRHASVADFGIAKAVRDAKVEGRMTTAGTSLGTPTYMAPEQAAGDEEVDQRADVYAVGVVAYELLAGRPPFEAPSHRRMVMAHIARDPEPLSTYRSGVPADLEEAVMRCLEKDPAARWQRVEELLRCLEAASLGTGPDPSGVVRASGDSGAAGPETGLASPRDSGGNAISRGLRWAGGSRGRSGALLLGVGAVVALSIVSGRWLRDASEASGEAAGSSFAPGDAPAVRLAIAPPENVTGDPEWDFLSARVDDAVRRAVAQYAPDAALVPRAALEGSEAGAGAAAAELLELAREEGATHLVHGRYLLAPDRIQLTMDVVDAGTGNKLRTLPFVEASLEMPDDVATGAADAVAVVAMMLVSSGGEIFALRYWPLARSPVAFRYQQSGTRAFAEGRGADAVDWFLRAIAEEPDWPTPYTTLRPALMNEGRVAEWEPWEPVVAALVPRMTEDQHDYWLWLTAPRLADQVDAGERRLRRHGGAGNIGYSLAFVAIQANRLALAREGLDTQDRDAGMVREWPPMWRLDAIVGHIEGDYSEELRVARDGVSRFPANRRLAEAEIRALLALDSIEAATDAVRRLGQAPGDRRTLWHLLHDVALEARRHGHAETSRDLFDELIVWGQQNDVSESQRAAALYGGGRHEGVVDLLRNRFTGDGAWRGPDAVPAEVRAHDAALLVMSLEILGKESEARRYEPALSAFPDGSSSLGRRWEAIVAARRGDATRAVVLLGEAFDDDMPFYVSSRLPDESLLLHNRPELEKIRDDPTFRRLMAPR